jgi:hypothetical protein
MVNAEPYSTKLKIELTSHSTSEDEPPKISTSIEVDLTDENVHAWFTVFSRVLLQAGFSDYVVMSGATKLAFNEWRTPEDMRKVAKEYDLVLKEDLQTLENDEEKSDD